MYFNYHQTTNCYSFVYLEYASEEEATKAADEHKEKELDETKLFVIKAMTVRKERFGLIFIMAASLVVFVNLVVLCSATMLKLYFLITLFQDWT